MTLSSKEEIRQKLNLETGKLTWPELERYFARGIVIHVDSNHDLLDIAAGMAVDNRDMIEQLLAAGQITRPDIHQAKVWHDNEQVFWTVVVAPWILIQEVVA